MSSTTPVVLVIDNDLWLVSAISARLESLGYRCLPAHSGEQGIATFHDQRVDLIISDINMPNRDGLSIAREVRKSSDVPIFFVTGYEYDYHTELRGFKGVQVVKKPIDTPVLMQMVEAELVATGRELPAR